MPFDYLFVYFYFVNKKKGGAEVLSSPSLGFHEILVRHVLKFPRWRTVAQGPRAQSPSPLFCSSASLSLRPFPGKLTRLASHARPGRRTVALKSLWMCAFSFVQLYGRYTRVFSSWQRLSLYPYTWKFASWQNGTQLCLWFFYRLADDGIGKHRAIRTYCMARCLYRNRKSHVSSFECTRNAASTKTESTHCASA